MIGALAASSPAIWFAWQALASDTADAFLALWAGLAAGVVVLLAGIAIGAAQFERRGTRLMEFAEAT